MNADPSSASFMIVITDGEANFGADPAIEAELARQDGTTVFAVGVGENIKNQTKQVHGNEKKAGFHVIIHCDLFFLLLALVCIAQYTRTGERTNYVNIKNERAREKKMPVHVALRSRTKPSRGKAKVSCLTAILVIMSSALIVLSSPALCPVSPVPFLASGNCGDATRSPVAAHRTLP